MTFDTNLENRSAPPKKQTEQIDKSMATEKCGKILIVDDNEDVLLSLNMLLKPYVEAIRVTTTPERILEFMDSFEPNVIMLDMNFHRDAISGEEGYEWLDMILKHNPKSVVLFITAYVDTEKAVRAIKAGAIDFIPKPWDKKKMLDTVKCAVELSKERNRPLCANQGATLLPNGTPNVGNPRKQETFAETNPQEAFARFIGESAAILNLKAQIRRVASTEANVLITGENGTGKDVVAHALHRLSGRKSKPFVSIDLGCIPENLFESELFGYERGAFTDAKEAKEGRIETADKGTLFLDEIGNLNLQTQQKLLTMIEKRQTQRIGSNVLNNVDVRILAATNANLCKKVSEGEFRQDLFYRLNTIELHLPPLRERGEDIILLAEHFLDIYSGKYSVGTLVLGTSAKKKLMQHAWPGNVRELQHCIERSVVLNDKAELSAEDIRLETPSATSASPLAAGSMENVDSLNLQTLEREAIKRAISLSNGNLTQAAELLGITRFALYRKIEKLGI